MIRGRPLHCGNIESRNCGGKLKGFFCDPAIWTILGNREVEVDVEVICVFCWWSAVPYSVLSIAVVFEE